MKEIVTFSFQKLSTDYQTFPPVTPTHGNKGPSYSLITDTKDTIDAIKKLWESKKIKNKRRQLRKNKNRS